ncbi:methyltransferase domain-containing protein [Myxococcaceae bacterium JPH2]|nr:methyltransferase domain-containing protein [Myxococcaceae bacterium JPH2]
MIDAREVYESYPDQYAALVQHEDREGNLLKAIRSRVSLAGLEVVELGAGTGRVTTLLGPHVRSVRAFDGSAPMLRLAQRELTRLGLTNCSVNLADNGSLPVPDASADLSIAGWTYGHQTFWDPAQWRELVEAGLRQMLRVLRPGGTAIVIETLGTGHSVPFQPPEQLRRYYELLEDTWGFKRMWIRTDYEFPSMDEGVRLLDFFFGEECARSFSSLGSTIYPECTGLWFRS